MKNNKTRLRKLEEKIAPPSDEYDLSKVSDEELSRMIEETAEEMGFKPGEYWEKFIGKEHKKDELDIEIEKIERALRPITQEEIEERSKFQSYSL